MGVLTIAPIVWAHRRNRLEPVTVVLVAVLLALNLWPGWTVRPQLFTYAFLSWLGLIMTEQARGSRRLLWCVPLIMVGWTNSHGGFLAGLGIFGVHVLGELVKETRQRSAGWSGRWLELVSVSLATLAAVLVNPYGIGLLIWVWDSVTWPRPEISEWWPISIFSLQYLSFKVLVLLSMVAISFTRRQRSWTQVAILALTAMQAFSHRRHTPLFAILATYWIPEYLDDCLLRFREWVARKTKLVSADFGSMRMHHIALVGLALLFIVLSFVQMGSLRVERSTYPVAAFEFIERSGLQGRMVTEFNWGQYCLYAFWPRILVSVDGRFDTAYSRKVLDVNLDFMMGNNPRSRNRSPKTGPFQADRVLDLGGPNLALIDRQRTECVRAIEQRTDWVLLYQDALAQIWGLSSMYDEPTSAQFFPPSARCISDEPQLGWVAYPASPGNQKRLPVLANWGQAR